MTNRLHATIGALAATAALSLGTADLASARPAYRIVNQASGMAVMPFAGATAWGVPLAQAPISGDRTQLWFVTKEPGTRSFSFKNVRAGYCIHPSSWLPRRAFLNLARCDTDPGARSWMLTVSSGTYTIRSNKSGYYMDVQEPPLAANSPVIQAQSDGSFSQRWNLRYAGEY